MKKASLIWLVGLFFLFNCAKTPHPPIQKELERIDLLSDYPMPLVLMDWHARAKAYDELLFGTKEGAFLPLSRLDNEDNLSILAYVGDFRSFNGGQEAINVFAALLTSTAVGVDKSSYLPHLEGFFNQELALYTNNIHGETGKTFWYELLPNILFAKLAHHYPQEFFKERLRSIANQWQRVATAMIERNSVEFTAYDFKNHELVTGNWLEPDAAIGIAYLLLLSDDLLAETSYTESARQLMLIVDKLEWNPFYEILSAYGPYVASRLNLQTGTHLNVSKYFDWLINGDSYVRPGWGLMQGRWGDYDVSGLVGNTSDAGGFAFAMNTFLLVDAIQEVALYDSRYANIIGKWLYNIVYNSRFFYRDGLPLKHQTGGASFEDDPALAVPFEGIRYREEGRTPMATGDAVKHGWAATNYSLYSGSYIGFMANLAQETEHPRALRFLLKEEQGVQSFLYYNASTDLLSIAIPLAEPVNIVETTQATLLAKNVSTYQLDIPPKSAKIIHLIPVSTAHQFTQNRLQIGDTYRASQQPLVLNVKGFPLVGALSGITNIMMATEALNPIKTLSIDMNGTQIYQGSMTSLHALDTTKFANGNHYITITVEDNKGNQDRVEKAFFIFNSGQDGAIFSLTKASIDDFQPIPLMMGSIQQHGEQWLIYEDNVEGHWGGVMTTLNNIDFDRQPMVMLGVDDLTSMWGAKIVFHDDQENPWGFYIKGDNSEQGIFTIDILHALKSYHPNLFINGQKDIDFWLFSVGEEGGFMQMNQLEIFYLQ